MRKKLKEISNIITGHVFRSKVNYDVQGNVNLLNMDSISTTGTVMLGMNDIKRIEIQDVKESEIISHGDILFKAKGLNNNAVIVEKIPTNTTVTSSCHIIRIIDKNFLPEFICVWLNSSAAKKHFSKGTGQATGITIANVSKTTLEELKIPCLPLKEQEIISNIEELRKQEKELMLRIAERKDMLSRAIIERELQKY